jgi:hypothetical protein
MHNHNSRSTRAHFCVTINQRFWFLTFGRQQEWDLRVYIDCPVAYVCGCGVHDDIKCQQDVTKLQWKITECKWANAFEK